MPQTMTQPLSATERETLPAPCGAHAKADLRPQVPATRLRDVAAEALQRTSSQKSAAIDIAISEGRLSHKLQDGSLTLAQLEALGPSYAVALGESLIEQFAPLATPKARALQQVSEAERALKEIRQALELIS